MNNVICFAGILIMLFTACDSSENRTTQTRKKSPRIRKSVELVSPGLNSNFKVGEPIDLVIKHKDANEMIDSAFAVINDQKIKFKGNQLTVSDSNKPGKLSIKILAYLDDKIETLYPSITILPDKEPISYTYRINATYPHDTEAWTQGLTFHNGKLYESTGQNGQSSLRQVDLNTGDVQSITNLSDEFFGEGVTVWKDNIYLLTWTSQKGFIYDLDFNLKSSFNYTTEGWGITTYGDTLIMSDGTEKLFFMHPEDFSLLKTLEVYDHKGKVDELNELEFHDGMIYANVWGKDEIVMINPNNGIVEGSASFDGIFAGYRANRYDKSMNGIAVDSKGRIFVTGKYWPELYQISLTPKNNPL